MLRILLGAVAAVYLLIIAYYAFRPFERIPGLRYEPAEIAFSDAAVHIRPGAALEDRKNAGAVRDALMRSGCITIEAVLRPDSLNLGGPARIVSYSRDPYSRNFTLAQEGNALVFRLRTTETDRNGILPCLVVPDVLVCDRMQHLAVAYDGTEMLLYVDGRLRFQTDVLHGDFSNWGLDQVLVIGDEPCGGRPWNGLIRRFSIFDRVLSAEEIAGLERGEEVGGAVLTHSFESQEMLWKAGVKRLRYRNLFVRSDPSTYQPADCLLNIVAFIPLGFMAFLALPMRYECRKLLSVFVLPLLLGLLVSGLIEWSQQIISTRIPCLLDLAYNVIGTVWGSLSAWLVFSVYKRKMRNWRDT
ncbi:MAG: LamG domain-containing protein [Pontiellaceae bacterium]|nr:LamG domain-containing protein [Pontiellaceae bacterium]MBN2783996.1 LamG domain-containing protein [Pontiellaceae bacterium]